MRGRKRIANHHETRRAGNGLYKERVHRGDVGGSADRMCVSKGRRLRMHGQRRSPL